MENKESISGIVKQKIEWITNNIWYMILLICSTYYVSAYSDSIYDFKELNIYNVVFIIWIALLIYPLIAEFEFLGLKIKKEVKKATAEQEERIQRLQQDLYEIRVNASINNQINLGLDKLLPLAELNQFLPNNLEVYNEKVEPIRYVDEKNTYLFKVRASLEVALRMLCEKLGNENRLNLSQSVGWLVRAGAIESKIGRLIYEVIKIANRGVHGESVSSEYVEFVKKVYPEIIKIIDNKVKD